MSGERIGQYTLIEPLADTPEPTQDKRSTGLKGAPRRYLARDKLRHLLVVAIYPSAIRHDPDLLRELARQIEALRNVQSPFIEEIFEANLQAERPYVVRGFVPGRSLSQLVRQYGPLPATDVSRLAAGLAEAIAELHRHGIVHGDLRPENVVWSSSAKPVLIDFGLSGARRVSDQADLEGPGWVAEVKTLQSLRPGPAADIFGWLSTVCFAATAEQPPSGGTAALAAHLFHSEGLRSQPQLESLLLRCLQPVPSERPDAEDLAQSLARQATALLEQLQEPSTDDADSSASQPRHRPQPAGHAGRAFARSFIDGFGHLFDIFTPLKPPEPLPPFESTIGQDLHELYLALGLGATDEESATGEPSP